MSISSRITRPKFYQSFTKVLPKFYRSFIELLMNFYWTFNEVLLISGNFWQGCIKLSQILISPPLLFDFFPKGIYKYIYRPIFDFHFPLNLKFINDNNDKYVHYSCENPVCLGLIDYGKSDYFWIESKRPCDTGVFQYIILEKNSFKMRLSALKSNESQFFALRLT